MKESFYSWNEYSYLFYQKAQDFNIPPDVISELLKYSKVLFDKKLPIIYDVKHLSFSTGFKIDYIERAIKGTGSFYRSFKIAKKNGKNRTITEPLPGLKELQYWILEHILKKIDPNKLNNAYSPGKSIITNAKYHTKQNKVLNVDIEKYFDNINYSMVYNFFRQLGYNLEVATVLTKLVTLNNGIPQGSPTSPYLSSLITRNIDTELYAYARERNLRYSRYADDITISGDFNVGVVIVAIKRILANEGFNINSRKTTVKKPNQRQMVTGVVVNKRLSIMKEDILKVRQEVYYIEKFGLEKHLTHIKKVRRNYLLHLLGKINFYMSVKKNDQNLLVLKKKLKHLILSEGN
jgi:RNA-directed DNA polymerase